MGKNNKNEESIVKALSSLCKALQNQFQEFAWLSHTYTHKQTLILHLAFQDDSFAWQDTKEQANIAHFCLDYLAQYPTKSALPILTKEQINYGYSHALSKVLNI